MNPYVAGMVTVLALHLIYLLWVIFGALIARRHRWLRWLHIASLIWGLMVVLLPWSCPLTILEGWLESRAGVEPYQGGFLIHYLNNMVYPDISPAVLTIAGMTVCLLNLGIYVYDWRASRARATI